MKERIKQLLAEKGLTQAEFADFIGVGRPSITHLMTGRDKSSQVVVSKTLLKFPEINPLWLLKGEGDMYRENAKLTVVTPEMLKKSAPEEIQADLFSMEDEAASTLSPASSPLPAGEGQAQAAPVVTATPSVSQPSEVTGAQFQAAPAAQTQTSPAAQTQTSPATTTTTTTNTNTTVMPQSQTMPVVPQQHPEPVTLNAQPQSGAVVQSPVAAQVAPVPAAPVAPAVPQQADPVPQVQPAAPVIEAAPSVTQAQPAAPAAAKGSKKIKKVVFFYADRTFEEFYPSED